MSAIAKKSFPAAIQVNDRFHLHQLVHDALQEVRVNYRWEALDAQNRAIKEFSRGYKPPVLSNGDTLAAAACAESIPALQNALEVVRIST